MSRPPCGVMEFCLHLETLCVNRRVLPGLFVSFRMFVFELVEITIPLVELEICSEKMYVPAWAKDMSSDLNSAFHSCFVEIVVFRVVLFHFPTNIVRRVGEEQLNCVLKILTHGLAVSLG